MARRQLRRFVTAASVLALSAPTFGASAAGPGIRDVLVSGPSPHPTCADPLRTEHIGSEHDIALAVDPSDPERLVAVWTQDDGVGTLAATSTDSGASWQRSVVPGITSCTGGSDLGTFDPGVAIGPDGTVYVSSPTWEGVSGFVTWGLSVSTSADGASWTAPVEIDRRTGVAIDWPTITADPRIPGRAWVVWTGINVDAGDSQTYLSRTDDGGDSWSDPAVIGVPPSGRANFMSRIHVLPDGDLAHVWIDFPAQPRAIVGMWDEGPSRILAARSTDAGATWSEPVHAASVPPSVLRDPETGQAYGGGLFFPLVTSAAGLDGSLHACWTIKTDGDVYVVTSTDGGRTWRSPQIVAAPGAPAFTCTIAADKTNRVAVSWYDFRDDVRGDEALSTSAWIALSAGSEWKENRLGGVFDFRASQPSHGSAHPHGDSFGLVRTKRSSFGAVFTQLEPLTADGISDVYFTAVH